MASSVEADAREGTIAQTRKVHRPRACELFQSERKGPLEERPSTAT
ncbi:hypothetical protein NDA01_29970 [Trichocoleus desertorum AS-A10]